MIFDVLVLALPVVCHSHTALYCSAVSFRKGQRCLRSDGKPMKRPSCSATQNSSQPKPNLGILSRGQEKDSYHDGNNNTSPKSVALLYNRPKQTHIVASIIESAGGVDVHSCACWSVGAHLELRLCLLHVIRQHPTVEGLRGDGGNCNDFHLTRLVVCVSKSVSEGPRGVTLLRSRPVSLRLRPIHHPLYNYGVQLPPRLSC